MIASAEGVIVSLLVGPAVLYLLWRWAVFSASLPAMKARPPKTRLSKVRISKAQRRGQFNEDSPGYRGDPGSG